ncbi:hypothetical protein D3C80_1352860 [compost metagenome]
MEKRHPPYGIGRPQNREACSSAVVAVDNHRPQRLRRKRPVRHKPRRPWLAALPAQLVHSLLHKFCVQQADYLVEFARKTSRSLQSAAALAPGHSWTLYPQGLPLILGTRREKPVPPCELLGRCWRAEQSFANELALTGGEAAQVVHRELAGSLGWIESDQFCESHSSRGIQR